MEELFDIQDCKGGEIDEIKDFYLKVNTEYSKKYTKIILLTRRSVILNEIFMSEKESLEFSENIISDTSIDSVSENDRVLIVDDIIIHGRAVTKLRKMLEQKCNQVDISAFYRFWGARLPEEYNVLDYYNVTSLDWRELSNKLVEIIIDKKIPYTTFTQSFKLANVNIQSNNDLSSPVSINELQDIQSQFRLNVYFADKNKYSLIKLISEFICIREYFYSNSDERVLVPFILIPRINNDLLLLLLDAEGFRILPKSIRDELESEKRGLVFKASLLSYVLSYLYGVVVIGNKISDDKKWETITTNILKRTFSPNIIYDLRAVNKLDAEKILNTNIQIDSNFAKIELIDDDRFFHYSDSVDIRKQLTALHSENELRAEKGKQRSEGYYAPELLKKSSNYYKYAAELISMWDIGYASFSYSEIDNNAFSCVRDGEQAYKVNLISYAKYMDSIYFLKKYLYLASDVEVFWNNYIDFLREKNLSSHQLEEIANAVNFFKYRNLYEYTISQIKGYTAYQEILDYTKDYIKSVIG